MTSERDWWWCVAQSKGLPVLNCVLITHFVLSRRLDEAVFAQSLAHVLSCRIGRMKVGIAINLLLAWQLLCPYQVLASPAGVASSGGAGRSANKSSAVNLDLSSTKERLPPAPLV